MPGDGFDLSGDLPFPLPFDHEASPLAQATAWCLERMALGDLDVDVVRSHFAVSEIRTAVDLAGQWVRMTAPLVSVSGYVELSPTMSRLEGVDDQGRRRNVRVVTTADDPLLIRSAAALHVAPPGVTVRPAEATDAEALRDLERRTPVLDGDAAVHYDRGPDALAYLRLLEHPNAVVAVLDGQVIAEHVDAFFDVRIGGKDRRVSYRHHTRIDPDHQGLKVWPALNFAAGTTVFSFPDEIAEQMLVRIGNDRMRELLGELESWAWDTEVELCLLDCAAVGDPSAVPGIRPARPSDAELLATLSNAAHDTEEVYRPMTGDDVRNRMERAPDLYTWGDVWTDGEAMVGVWASGVEVAVGDIIERRAIVLDSGWTPGAGDAALEKLLRQWCRQLHEQGTTHLAALTSTASPDREVLHRLAGRIERYLHLCRVPPGDATAGIRLDAAAF